MRPLLNPIDLELAFSKMAERPAKHCCITMAVGQWDRPLSTAYENSWILLEVEDDKFVAAYQKA